ncbi:MAG: hypothetical protein ACREVI_00650 [Steroidobacteraceae bacterium]
MNHNALMTQTLMLSKVLGLFAVIAGVAMVIRGRQFAEVIVTFAKNRTIRVMIAAIELLAGLFLVIQHNEWGSPPAILISLLGWMAVVESAGYLLLPDAVVDPFLRIFARASVIRLSGIFALAIGLYLAGHGFGMIQ